MAQVECLQPIAFCQDLYAALILGYKTGWVGRPYSLEIFMMFENTSDSMAAFDHCESAIWQCKYFVGQI